MYDNRIKYCREELELTQKELGYIFGVSDSTVRGWENNYDYIPLKKLIRFCYLYNYSLDYVLNLNNTNIKYDNPKINTQTIGKNLKKIRLHFSLSQQKMANSINISQSCYSKYENGKILLTTLTLYSIANKYSVSADIIIGRHKSI